MPDKRVTISMSAVVWQFAEEIMQSRGYNNFSALVADLIRQHRDELHSKEKRPGGNLATAATYPASHSSPSALNDSAKAQAA